MSPQLAETLSKLIEERQEVCTEIASIEMTLASTPDNGEAGRNKILCKLGYCRSRERELSKDISLLNFLEIQEHKTPVKLAEFQKETELAKIKMEETRLRCEVDKAQALARQKEEEAKALLHTYNLQQQPEITARKAKEQEEKTKRFNSELGRKLLVHTIFSRMLVERCVLSKEARHAIFEAAQAEADSQTTANTPT